MQPLNPLAWMQVFDYKVAFIPIHLVFLELDTSLSLGFQVP